jgi:hypothetical protein
MSSFKFELCRPEQNVDVPLSPVPTGFSGLNGISPNPFVILVDQLNGFKLTCILPPSTTSDTVPPKGKPKSNIVIDVAFLPSRILCRGPTPC